jgi:SAM-dependent MidA family methyltransferase
VFIPVLLPAKSVIDNAGMSSSTGSAESTLAPLTDAIARAIAAAGGWLSFDRFMALALYAPGRGYYANASRKFGRMPSSGSDFVTAPEMTPLFGRALAVQVGQALAQTGTNAVWEFGAGSGALALQLLDALGERVARYTIVDLSGTLRERQRHTLARYADRVEWLDEWPAAMRGVVVGNEVLDAMPVRLLARTGGEWFERGVVQRGEGFAWSDRPTALRPPCAIEGGHDYLTEIHPQAEGFIRSLAERLTRGAAFFIDYGFPEHEYYHPQRDGGTVMCHRGHQSDADPLADPGDKDITAHVNFSAIALAGQDAGWSVLGYTSQTLCLLNCGLAGLLQDADPRQRIAAQPLLMEHEMGELFKVVGFAAAATPFDALGFAAGDRSHTL